MTRKYWLLSVLACFAFAVGVTPFLVQGNQQLRETREENAFRVSKLSESQLSRLKRNETFYRNATADERSNFQNIHAALEKDRQTPSQELIHAMESYDAWLNTINPYQREQLDKTRDPKERIALMTEILKGQPERVARRNMRFAGPGGDRAQWEPPPSLDATSLAAVMQAVQQAADPRLTAEMRAELDQLHGLSKYVRLLKILKANGNGLTPKPLMEAPPVEFQQVAREVQNTISDERLRKFISDGLPPVEGAPAFPGPPEHRLVLLVSQSLFTDLHHQRRAAMKRPETAKLQKFLDELPGDQQFELLALDSSDFLTDLQAIYFDKNGVNSLPSAEEIIEIFFGANAFRRGSGNRWRPEGGPGDRPPFSPGDGRGGRPSRTPPPDAPGSFGIPPARTPSSESSDL
ncbi:hypothetical protein SH668x_003505 [Planctomicrobium sp. SH668]|uniref:hypothetical protein n=1 Tax=Planctomicrobium sp. SH668 TaxID=3448126 RepID=UPI003F5C88D4